MAFGILQISHRKAETPQDSFGDIGQITQAEQKAVEAFWNALQKRLKKDNFPKNKKNKETYSSLFGIVDLIKRACEKGNVAPKIALVLLKEIWAYQQDFPEDERSHDLPFMMTPFGKDPLQWEILEAKKKIVGMSNRIN